ncbi:MAG: glycosyltransferase family 4 protein [Aquificaceae bacterium]
MLRILQIVEGEGWSGTKEQTYLISRELSLRGFEVHMALSFQYDLMVKKLKDYGIKFHFFEKHNKFSRFNPLNYYRLWKIMTHIPFHIAIANSPHALDFLRGVLSFLQKKPRIIAYKRTGKSSSFLSKLVKYSVADKIVVVDKSTYEKLKEEKFFPEKLTYIPSGLDLSRFKVRDTDIRLKLRKDLGIDPKNKVFINVANWNPQHKGQLLLIEAFSKLNCSDCILILVGLKTEEEAPKYAQKYGLDGRLIGLGFREDIPDLLNIADYFVFSSYFEGIAGAVLQAMACGKVVISTLAGGIKDYLRDGENGLAAKVGDLQGFVDKLKRALSLSQEEKEKISEKAIQTAKAYSIESTVNKYMELFKELVG